MGSSDTIVVSREEAPLSLPCTRLPGVTRWRLTRPVIGASTWVNSILSCAAFNVPSACISAACAAAAGDRRQHLGELDIELRSLQRAFGLHFGRVRSLERLAALVDGRFRDGL